MVSDNEESKNIVQDTASANHEMESVESANEFFDVENEQSETKDVAPIVPTVEVETDGSAVSNEKHTKAEEDKESFSFENPEMMAVDHKDDRPSKTKVVEEIDSDEEFISQLKTMKLGKHEEKKKIVDMDKTLDEDDIVPTLSTNTTEDIATSLPSPPSVPPRSPNLTVPAPGLPPREHNSKPHLLPAYLPTKQTDNSDKTSPNSETSSIIEKPPLAQRSPESVSSTSKARFKRSMIQVHAVPPPLSEEYKSPRFLKNLKIIETVPPPNISAREGTSLMDHIEDLRVNSSAASPDYDMIISRMNENSKNAILNQQSVVDSSNGLKTTYKTIRDKLIGKSSRNKKKGEEVKKDLEDDIHSILSYDEDGYKEISVDWPFWTSVVFDYEKIAQQEPEKLEREISKGIPPQIRGVIWQLISRSKSKAIDLLYGEMLAKEYATENVIKRDLKRTNFIPHDQLDSLFNVLKAYANYDEDVGYTQGMGFITTPLILQAGNENDAFGLLVRLMESYKVKSLFLPGMPGLMILLYQFDRLLEETNPGLYNHLLRQGVKSSMYATQWFLTFFGYKFPLEFVLRIFDIIFVEGIESLLKFSIALMVRNESNIMANSKFETQLDFLKNDLFNCYMIEKPAAAVLGSSNYSRKSKSSLSLLKTSTNQSVTTLEDTNNGDTINNNNAASLKYNVDDFIFDAMKIKIMPISLKRYEMEFNEIHEAEVQKEEQFERLRIRNKNLEDELTHMKKDFNSLKHDHEAISNELIQKRLILAQVIDEKKDLEEDIANEKRIKKEHELQFDIPMEFQQELQKTIDRNMEVMNQNDELENEVLRLNRVIEDMQSNGNNDDEDSKKNKPGKQQGSGSWKLFK